MRSFPRSRTQKSPRLRLLASRVFRYSLIVKAQEAGLSLLFALLLIGIPTVAVLYDFFTGGDAVTKLGQRNSLQQISIVDPPPPERLSIEGRGK